MAGSFKFKVYGNMNFDGFTLKLLTEHRANSVPVQYTGILLFSSTPPVGNPGNVSTVSAFNTLYDFVFSSIPKYSLLRFKLMSKVFLILIVFLSDSLMLEKLAPNGLDALLSFVVTFVSFSNFKSLNTPLLQNTL